MKKGLVRYSEKQRLAERSCIYLSYLDFVFPRTTYFVYYVILTIYSFFVAF